MAAGPGRRGGPVIPTPPTARERLGSATRRAIKRKTAQKPARKHKKNSNQDKAASNNKGQTDETQANPRPSEKELNERVVSTSETMRRNACRQATSNPTARCPHKDELTMRIDKRRFDTNCMPTRRNHHADTRRTRSDKRAATTRGAARPSPPPAGSTRTTKKKAARRHIVRRATPSPRYFLGQVVVIPNAIRPHAISLVIVVIPTLGQ